MRGACAAHPKCLLGEVWSYGDQLIEVVNSYKHLGLHVTTKLSLTLAVSELASKAKLRTIQILRCLFKLGNVQRDVFFKNFRRTGFAYANVWSRNLGLSTV